MGVIWLSNNARKLAVMKSIDAIIVPASRPVINLAYATQIAQLTGSILVTLCSRSVTASQARNLTSQPSINLNVDYQYNHELLDGFFTNDCAQALTGRRLNDISIKRNLGLLLARLVGWQTILYLDDDITYLEGLDATTMTLSEHGIMGWKVHNFPDNSVVRHAERLSGHEPGLSLSGSPLLIDTRFSDRFFPNIYNEDWLFFHELLGNTNPYIIGQAKQKAYDPFLTPMRAVGEEFGDLIAEGLRTLIRFGISSHEATKLDWQDIINERQILIRDSSAQLLNLSQSKMVRTAQASLQAAATRLDSIRPEDCTQYVQGWRKDRELWQLRYSRIPSDLTITAALKYLKLDHAPIFTDRSIRLKHALGSVY